jgi:hypothetical protein
MYVHIYRLLQLIAITFIPGIFGAFRRALCDFYFLGRRYVHTCINTHIHIYRSGAEADIVSGSIMGASRVFRTRPFSARWLRLELRNNNTVFSLYMRV